MGYHKEVLVESKVGKKLLSTFIVTLMLLASFVGMLSSFTISGSAAESYVGNGDTIQDAINTANNGDTITVGDGIYTENVIVNKSLTIRSENGSANCIVNASDQNDHVFNVTVDWVNISGFTVKDTTGDYAAGIYLDSVNHCIITNNNASYNSIGIFLMNVSYTTISNNAADNNTGLSGENGPPSSGILVAGSHNIIRDNELQNNTYGILVTPGDAESQIEAINNTIVNNTANSNDYGIALAYAPNNTVTDNTANSNNENGIYLDASDNNTIINNTVNSNNNAGIYVIENSSNNTIIDNIVNENSDGIHLDSSNNNIITGNTANSNTINHGIWLWESCNNTLTNNTASLNNEGGICLDFSSDNTLTNNTANSNNHSGIQLLQESHNNTVTNSTANLNNHRGICLQDSSNHNTIVGNTVNSNNASGIFLDSSNNTLIYNNYFDNINNAWDNGINIWNISKTSGNNIIDGSWLGGNYWSDYAGSDTNDDGLGDTSISIPHNCSGNIQNGGDFLPLVGQQGEGNGTIRGWVENNETHQRIQGATVMINRTDQQQPPAFVVTNATGKYIFNDNVSAGTYDVTAFKGGEHSFEETSCGMVVTANDTKWVNFTIDFGGGQGEGNTTIAGRVRDKENLTPLPGTICISIQDDDQGGQGLLQNEFETDENGNFSINMASEEIGGTPGRYSVEVTRDGYMGYMNWSVVVSENQTAYLDILLTPLFEEPSYIVGKINSSSTGETLENATIIFFDSDFTHMMEDDFDKEYTNNETVNGVNYCFNITVLYNSTYNLVIFKDGYYAKLQQIPYVEEGTVNWVNLSLNNAEPDTLTMTIEFFDLDDAQVTVNRTIVAASPIVRFSLDFMPEVGNSDSIVNSDEVQKYLGMIRRYGPTVNVSLEDDAEPKEGEEERGPDFLNIPVAIILDGSYLNKYMAGSHDGTIENIVNTTITSNATIYYNATFNITLDGSILNQITHPFNVSTEVANLVTSNITFIFSDFYNVTEIVNNNTNGSIINTTNTLTIVPGNGSFEELKHANFTLEFNASTVSLPIVEVPTWHMGDEWKFNRIESNETTEVTFSVEDKPLRRWDRNRFRIGNENLSYVTYKLAEESTQGRETHHVEMNDLDWIKLSEQGIDYLINDVDFPLYTGKTWSTTAWWAQQRINATVIDCANLKNTTAGIFECVKINYTGSGVVAQEWYSPDAKFFVNRTTYDGENINTSLNLKSRSLAPYFISTNLDRWDSDLDELYNYINVTVEINASGLNNPTEYEIEGPLFKESEGPWNPPTDIEWVNNRTTVTNETTQILMQYSGSIINVSGVDGPYKGWFELRRADHWGPPIDYIEFQTNSSWKHTDFQSPPLTLLSLSDYANDIDGNGAADYLTVNVTVNVLESGNYRICGGLHKEIGWDWRWITGTGTDVLQLSSGTQTIALNFNGREIYEAGYNGKYRMNLEIQNDDTGSNIARNESDTINSYQYTQFETPSVFFNKTWMEQSGEHDYIGGSHFIINASITVGAETFGGGTGTYDLHGGIHLWNETCEWGQFLAGMGRDITLSEGENVVTLIFNAGEMQEKLGNIQGNFSLIAGIGLSEKIGDWWGPDIDNTDYKTKNYTSNDFPTPTVSIQATDDYINDSWLTVNITVNTSEDGGAGTYDLHGGVHWVEQVGEDERWWHITGTGLDGPVVIGVNESKSFALNFNGKEIYTSGHNGPYKVWIGLENWSSRQMVAHTEYTTKNHSYDSFTAPSARFIRENMTDQTADYQNGTDYLTINASISVSESGHYHIGGGIHWVDTSSGWEDWRFITGTGTGILSLSPGNHIIPVNFNLGDIRAELERAGYSGSLHVNLGLESESWEPLDHIDYRTQPYSYAGLPAASISFTDCTDDIINGDLVVNVTLNATQQGNYHLHGGVHYVDTSSGWNDWRFITGTGEEIVVNPGDTIESVTFSGREIYGSGQNGPYMLWLGLQDQNWMEKAHKEHQTDAYNYTDFSSPEVRIIKENMTAGSADDINGTYLTINVSLNVGTAGTYKLDGGLNYVISHGGWDEWQWITGVDTMPTYFAAGQHSVPLNFNAREIYTKLQDAGYSGTLRAWIGIRNATTWEDIDHIEYTTNSYSYADFPAPGITFGSMPDGQCDYLNDTSLTINVTINVGSEDYAGEYDLHGGIHYLDDWGGWYHITGTGRWTELSNGTQIVPLGFNAGEIQAALDALSWSYNNNLTAWVGLSSTGGGSWEEIISREYRTQTYTADALPPPGIEITNVADYINGSYLTVNLTVNVSAEYADTYDVHGGVNYVYRAPGGWDEWRFITGTGGWQELSAGINTIALNFNGGEIYTNGRDGPYTICLGIENMITREQLATTEYETQAYLYTNFSAPGIEITNVADYINGSYLTVNVTINVTSDDYNGTYDVHGGIHYIDTSHGWEEWRFITGTGTQAELINGTNVVPVNFNGRMIYQSGHDGPYEMWIGISNATTREDITHTEHETQAYSYTQFPSPGVTIISGTVSDFANDTTGDGQADYLTINVTMNISESGDYFLEGGLHWMSGYEWRWITWAGTEIDSSLTGEQTILLNFDGKEIYAAGQNDGWTGGRLVAWISVRNTTNWNEICNIEPPYMTEQNYNPEDFSLLPAAFNRTVGITDDGLNTTGDNNYEWLRVNVTVDVSSAGNFKISGALFDPINKTIMVTKTNSTTLANGTQSVELLFNGSKINLKRYNGTYEFRAKIFEVNDELFECDKIKATTNSYTYNEFIPGTSPATLVSNFSSYKTGNNLVINVTVNVSQTGTLYEIYGDLFNNETGLNTTWITSATNTTYFNNNTGNQVARLVFNGSEIRDASINGTYKLAYIRLSMKEDTMWCELESMTDAHTTAEYSYTDFGGV